MQNSNSGKPGVVYEARVYVVRGSHRKFGHLSDITNTYLIIYIGHLYILYTTNFIRRCFITRNSQLATSASVPPADVDCQLSIVDSLLFSSSPGVEQFGYLFYFGAYR
jgi:hypothetical protein